MQICPLEMLLPKAFFKCEKASAHASSDRFLPMIKPNIQNNAINCTNLGKQ